MLLQHHLGITVTAAVTQQFNALAATRRSNLILIGEPTGDAQHALRCKVDFRYACTAKFLSHELAKVRPDDRPAKQGGPDLG